MNPRATPSLRIARLVITNFRTFREPTEIVLTSKEGADEMPVFHGGNGTGKSNALAAIDLFFRATSTWLGWRKELRQQREGVALSWDWADQRTGWSLSHRNWPPGVRDPQTIEAHFADAALGTLRITLTPAGNECYLRAEQPSWPKDQAQSAALTLGLEGRSFYQLTDPQDVPPLKNALEAPLGPGSKPFFLLDARRRPFKAIGDPGYELITESPLSSAMTRRLLAMATSLDPGETERWRAFASLVGRFKTLQGRELSVIQGPGLGDADLRFEIRGKQILRLSELSSGEQQVIALCAAVLTSQAAIVAVEEPEISLHPDNQKLIRDVLREQVRSGIVDQIFLESHVPVFDGAEVIRFSRSTEGTTTAIRGPSRSDDEVRRRAEAAGVKAQWVTAEGYTQLPDPMRQDLNIDQGGYLWFLRSKPKGRWEAWKAEELDQMLGFDVNAPEDE